MTKDEFIQYAINKGWTQDRFGHLNKPGLRLKIQAHSVVLQRSYHTEASPYSKSKKVWHRIVGGYFSKLSINEDGTIAGMS